MVAKTEGHRQQRVKGMLTRTFCKINREKQHVCIYDLNFSIALASWHQRDTGHPWFHDIILE